MRMRTYLISSSLVIAAETVRGLSFGRNGSLRSVQNDCVICISRESQFKRQCNLLSECAVPMVPGMYPEDLVSSMQWYLKAIHADNDLRHVGGFWFHRRKFPFSRTELSSVASMLEPTRLLRVIVTGISSLRSISVCAAASVQGQLKCIRQPDSVAFDACCPFLLSGFFGSMPTS